MADLNQYFGSMEGLEEDLGVQSLSPQPKWDPFDNTEGLEKALGMQSLSLQPKWDHFDNTEGLEEDPGVQFLSPQPKWDPFDNTDGLVQEFQLESQLTGFCEWDYLQDTTNENLVVLPSDTGALGVDFMCKITPPMAREWLGEDGLKRKPLAVLGLCLLAVVLGHLLDKHVLPKCPPCRVALQAANRVL